MEFPASRHAQGAPGKRAHVAFRATEQPQAGHQDRLRLAKIQEAEILEVHGDWMFVQPARWPGPAWVNLQHVLYLDMYQGE
jgi:hypothetical protein